MPDTEDGRESPHVVELRRVFHDAVTAIEAIPDPQEAFDAVTRLVVVLREAVEQAGQLRARAALRIMETESLSLSGLANKIGTSKARADQLIRSTRKEERAE